MNCLIDNDNYDAITISNFKNEKTKSSDTQVCVECWDNIKPGIEFYQASGQCSGEDSDFEEPTNSLFVYTTCETCEGLHRLCCYRSYGGLYDDLQDSIQSNKDNKDSIDLENRVLMSVSKAELNQLLRFHVLYLDD